MPNNVSVKPNALRAFQVRQWWAWQAMTRRGLCHSKKAVIVMGGRGGAVSGSGSLQAEALESAFQSLKFATLRVCVCVCGGHAHTLRGPKVVDVGE